jgi:FtsP/CotA-like multicopper oxidase with cupredoxin domain
LGNGIKQFISPQPRLKYFEGMKMMNDMMKMNGDLDDMGMNMSLNQMDMNVVMYPEITGDSKQKETQTNEYGKRPKPLQCQCFGRYCYAELCNAKSPNNTTLPKDAPVKELKFELTGNMNRYVWSLDNKVVSEVDKIP